MGGEPAKTRPTANRTLALSRSHQKSCAIPCVHPPAASIAALGLSSTSQRLSFADGPSCYAGRQGSLSGADSGRSDRVLGVLLLGRVLEQPGQGKPAILLDRMPLLQKAGTGIPLHAWCGHSWSPMWPDRCKVRCITVPQPRRTKVPSHLHSTALPPRGGPTTQWLILLFPDDGSRLSDANGVPWPDG